VLHYVMWPQFAWFWVGSQKPLVVCKLSRNVYGAMSFIFGTDIIEIRETIKMTAMAVHEKFCESYLGNM